MMGFRILSIILALLCLAGAAALYFHDQPAIVSVSGFFLNEDLRGFVESDQDRDIAVRNHLKYLTLMGAVGSFGLAVLFFVSAVNPMGMRPFVVTLIICLILGIAAALWKGPRLDIYSKWWLADAAGGVVLTILLITFFPRRPAPPPPPLEEKVGLE